MKNERTSRKVAKIASEVLRRCGDIDGDGRVLVTEESSAVMGRVTFIDCCTAKELKALAASALTQTPDRK